MNGVFAEEWAVFPDRYAGHLALSLGALALGCLISIPLGLVAARSARVAGGALGAASVVQTIPSLALLALMVPALGGRIGFWPAFVALTLNSVLPILRNTIVSLRGVDADVREAALAVGMTERQRLIAIDLPLSGPVIVAGLRTASVWVVGAATLSTPVGAQSIGNYIFAGLQTRNWGTVIFGCLVASMLAIALDQVIAQLERGLQSRRRWPLIAAAAGFLAICAPVLMLLRAPEALATRPGGETAGYAATSLEGRRVVIGAKGFTEQLILSQLLKDVLEAKGARVEVREGLGSVVSFDALANGEVDVTVDYSGTVWTALMKRDAPAPRALMFAEVSSWLLNEHGVLAFGRLGFENAYAFGATRESIERHGLASIADLAGRPLVIAGDAEFFGRPEWIGARDAYGLQALQTRSMDSTFMYGAAQSGEADVITAYTTDGRLDAFDIELIDDPLGVLPPYDAFLLISPKAKSDRALLRALEPLRLGIDGAMMRRANGMVDLERRSVQDAATWLRGEIPGLSP
ncbi:ABC transporter permease subunit [bacterium]|nr:ABC transporter permease subunit [bacterium]